jgi:uncharacterized protein YeaO (DUF488 family)
MAKTIEIFTVQVARWRLVRELGIHFLDVTAKSGNPAFAPHFEDVMHYKHHEMPWDEFVRIYHQRMRQSRRDSPEEWEKLKDLPEKVAVACYCAPDQPRCHRHLFKHLLADYLKDNQIEVIMHGEITSYGPQYKEKVNDVPATGSDNTAVSDRVVSDRDASALTGTPGARPDGDISSISPETHAGNGIHPDSAVAVQ